MAGVVSLKERVSERQLRSTPHKRIRPIRLDLLVVIDSSDASTRAVRYLGEFFARRRDVRFCLTYLTPKVPAALLESGGAEEPHEEEKIETALREDQEEWMTSAAAAAEDVIDGARATLQQAGVPAGAISTCQMSPLDNCSTAEELLLVARQQRCRTIVVGHSAHAWFSGAGGGHLAEHLVREARGFAVWVVD
jgi:nucleotide-binding universal stress UspA family protein